MRDGHKQTEISVVETIGGHGRWRPGEGTEFLSKLTINNCSFAKIYYSCPMGGGDDGDGGDVPSELVHKDSLGAYHWDTK
jgi:hypothetical protein